MIGFIKKKIIERKLLSLLKKDEYPTNKIDQILITLCNLGTKKAINAVIEFMNGDLFSTNAIEIVGKLKIKESVKPLEKILLTHKSFMSKIKAAQSLEEIGDRKAIPSLIKALNDSDDAVREDVALALGGFGGEEVAAELKKAFEKESSNRVKGFIVQSIGYTKDQEQVDWLIDILQKDEEKRIYAAIALGELGNEKAIEPLLFFLNDKNSKKELLERIVLALGNIGKPNEQVVNSLIAILKIDNVDYRNLKLNTIKALGQISAKRAVPPLLDIYKKSGRVEQYEVIEAFGKIGDESVVEPLLEIWRRDESNKRDYKFKDLLINTFSQLKNREAIEIILKD